MRILLDYRPALRQRTGVGEYVHELARALVAAPPQSSAGAADVITLFSSSWKDRLSPDVIPGARVCDRRVPVRALNFAWHRLGWPAAETLAGGEFDVVQAAHPLLIPTRRAAQVVTIYDLDFLDHPERTRAEIRRDYPVLAAAHARRADRVITISKFTAREIEQRLGVPASRISICHPGAPPWARREEEPAAGPLLFLGTLEPRKNLGELLDAYERLVSREPAIPRLVLAGRVTPDAESLVARTRRLPLAGRVDVLGYVDPERRLRLFREALALVLPSHAEGFGMPALEALTCGVPVVVANRGALPEVVGDAGRLFEPGDTAGLAEALREVLTDAALRQRMRVAGWRQARQFQWSESATRAREAWVLAVEERQRRRARV